MTAATPDRRAIITEALHKIDDLTARLEIAEKSSSEPIAVIGMGCRFPAGSTTPNSSGICCAPAEAASSGFPRSGGTPTPTTVMITPCRGPSAAPKAVFSPAGSQMSSMRSSSQSPRAKRRRWTRSSDC